MTEAEIKMLVGAFGPVVREDVEAQLAPLKARIAELEGAPFLRDVGVWREGTSYGIGSVCTDHGSAWVCRSPTTSRPPDAAWRLMVKRGMDAPRGGMTTFSEAVDVIDRFVANTLRNDEAELRELGFAVHEITERMRAHRDHCYALRDRAVEEMRAWFKKL